MMKVLDRFFNEFEFREKKEKEVYPLFRFIKIIAFAMAISFILGGLSPVVSGQILIKSASSSGTSANHLIDGDLWTIYSSQKYSEHNPDEEVAIILDFGIKHYNVSGIGLYPQLNGWGFPTKFELLYSEDGDSWTSAAIFENIEISTRRIPYFFYAEPFHAQFVKVKALELRKDQTEQYALQFSNIVVMKEDGNLILPIHLEYNGVNVPIDEFASLINGGPEIWESERQSVAQIEQSISLHFTKRHRLNNLTIRWPADGFGRPSNIQIAVSADGELYDTLDVEIIEERLQTKFLFSPVNAQAIRIEANDLGQLDNSEYGWRIENLELHSKSPFRSNAGGDFDRIWNELWLQFGAVDDGTAAVYRFGNEPNYFEWMARKIMWSDMDSYKAGLKDRVRHFPQAANGYVWSWGSQPRWPSGNALHFTTNPMYILAAWRIAMWDDFNYLNEIDEQNVISRADGDEDLRDDSEGKTVWEKIQLAMQYMEMELGGNDGLLIIDNDENDGTPEGMPSNYWDNLKMGYLEPYTNLYYYASLLAMSDLWKVQGDQAQSRIYRNRAELIRKLYNETFWDDTKSRYVSTIDIHGNVWDFGLTFLNLEAAAYGLPDQTQAEAIFTWLDGERIIEGDFSTGSDIYAYGLAPRANTIPIESVGPPYWWNDVNGGIDVTQNGSWNRHLENGGFIFYTSFYDILARTSWIGPENAWVRMEAITKEYRFDEVRRDPNVWQMGVIGEFPESGLVPAAIVHAFVGLDANSDGLIIAPAVPKALNTITIDRVVHQGHIYEIEAGDNYVRLLVEGTSNGEQIWVIKNLENSRDYKLEVTDLISGEVALLKRTTSREGQMTLRQEWSGPMSFEISLPKEQGPYGFIIYLAIIIVFAGVSFFFLRKKLSIK